MPALEGMWLATVCLMPIAIIILVQARNDSPVFKKEAYINLWRKIKGIFVKEQAQLK
jgi:hypothetical protein